MSQPFMVKRSPFHYSVSMDHKVSMYVPSTNNTNQATDNNQQVQHIARQFSMFFGGATATQASGYWNSDQAGLVRELVTIVYAYTDLQTLNNRYADIESLALQLKSEMSQESVAIEIDNTLYLL